MQMKGKVAFKNGVMEHKSKHSHFQCLSSNLRVICLPVVVTTPFYCNGFMLFNALHHCRMPEEASICPHFQFITKAKISITLLAAICLVK